MLRNYLTIVLRNLRKRPIYAFINVTGLALGMACGLLIALYVYDEWRYDRFHEKADRIVRLSLHLNAEEELAVTPSILAPLLKRTLPEVEEAVRINHATMFGPVVVQHDEHRYAEHRFYYADSTLFRVFTYAFLAGTPETALNRPGTIVLTASAARRYFGDRDPLGRTLTVNGTQAFEVTGVVADPPSNTHLAFDFVASLTTRKGWPVLSDDAWQAANFMTYLLLRDEAAVAAVREKLPALIEQSFGDLLEASAMRVQVGLQRLTEIHLYHEGYITYVYLFAAAAFLILLIACVNFMNLSTARSAERAKEVGVRKAVGAARGSLVRQFLAESVLLALFALGLALLLAELALPLFRMLSGKAFPAGVLLDPALLLLLAGAALTVGLLAGLYPAVVLSGFRPAVVLKGAFTASAKGALLRRTLVVFQFAIVVFLLVGTLVIQRQLRYVQEKNLGFEREQVVALPIGDRRVLDRYETIKQEVLQLAGVRHVAAVSSLPGNMHSGYRVLPEGRTPEEALSVTGVPADRDVVETLGLALVAGPGFPKSPAYAPEQEGYGFILNETAVRRLGWSPEEAIGQTLHLHARVGKVVGVVRDFHATSLHRPIEPLVLFIEPWQYEHLLVRVAPEDVPGTLAALERIWSRQVPHRPFDYTFLDQAYDALYRAEQRVGQVFGAFAVLATLVACLGLFGLASFTTEQRTKEIGVRKVLGASIPSIVLLLSKDFAKLVLAAFAAAVPAGYVVMGRWLEGFAYRTEIGVDLFLLAGAAALVVALLTVSYQAFRAAAANPVESLRYE